MESFERLKSALADRYTVERKIGAGGMADVFLTHDVRHNRKVAIKVMHRDLAELVGVERFLREIETTAKLQHPHILPLFDSGSVDGTVFYVMPYVEGARTLRVPPSPDSFVALQPRKHINVRTARIPFASPPPCSSAQIADCVAFGHKCRRGAIWQRGCLSLSYPWHTIPKFQMS